MPGIENRLWRSVTSKISDIYMGVLALVLPRTTLLSVWPSKSHVAILALCPFSLGHHEDCCSVLEQLLTSFLVSLRILGCEELLM